MKLKTVRIGGVPEHFNLPWHLCITEKAFEKVGIILEWIDFPGGTGAMNQALRAGTIDMAVILSEGIIKDIIDGNPSKIVQAYIKTPLIWGIHVGAKSDYQTIDDLKNTRAAISRYGSGSHLMTYLLAQKEEWNTTELQFEVIQNLDGAVEALTIGTADYFLWEHYTTKPLVEKGIFRRIGDYPTPWPCFVIAARTEVLDADSTTIQSILQIINKKTKDFKNISGIETKLAKRYQQDVEDITAWLRTTEWSQQQLNKETIDLIQNRLLQLEIISETKSHLKFI